MDQKYFNYGQKEINYLARKDAKMAAVIQEIGIIKRAVNHNLYQSIVQSIVGQQISTTVQHRIMHKLKETYPAFNAETIARVPDTELRSLGLSLRKVSYIKAFSTKVATGTLDLDALYTLTDDEVIKSLTTVKGIGTWTAEMTLLFSLERPNIFSFGDLAIKRGLQIIYGHDEITKPIFEKYRQLFAPYGSVASLYLWEVSRR